MSSVMRPHLKRTGSVWECRSRAIFGGWIVARGLTVKEAYVAWVARL